MGKQPVQPQDKYVLRLPDGMREQLKGAAMENNRSMNAEIVARLEDSLDPTLIAHAFHQGYGEGLVGTVVDLLERRTAELSETVDLTVRNALASAKGERALPLHYPSSALMKRIRVAERELATGLGGLEFRLESMLRLLAGLDAEITNEAHLKAYRWILEKLAKVETLKDRDQQLLAGAIYDFRERLERAAAAGELRGYDAEVERPASEGMETISSEEFREAKGPLTDQRPREAIKRRPNRLIKTRRNRVNQ